MSEQQLAVQMTAEELAQFKAFQEAKMAQKAKEDAQRLREDYRRMVDYIIETTMPRLINVSDSLSIEKKRVFEDFSTIIQMKEEIFRVLKDKTLDNQSHTFTNSEGNMRIVLGNYVTDGYLDTADEGIAKVQAYITSLASDEKSQALVKMVMRLLAKDAKGTLKASRIIQLRKMAEESGSSEFIEGVKIIEEAYQPQVSRTYIKAYYRHPETGGWEQVPLGMTES